LKSRNLRKIYYNNKVFNITPRQTYPVPETTYYAYKKKHAVNAITDKKLIMHR